MPSAPVRVLLTLSITCGAVLALSCSEDSKPPAPPAETEPPPFNAFDPTLTCPVGQVGWDFTTGGGISGEPFSSSPVRGIRIQKAWYAYNCANVAGFDFTSTTATLCDSKDQCDWFISTPTDLAHGCTKKAIVEWKCGVESPVYTLTIDNEARDQHLRPTCGGKMEIVSASYGYNCGVSGAVQTAQTDTMSDACNDYRRCTFDPNVVFGDPAVGCGKRMRVQYRCGSDNTLLTSETGQELVSFACPVLDAPDSPTVSVVAATYGQSCAGGLTVAQQAAHLGKVKDLCDGKVACAVLANNDNFGDPKAGCAKSLEVSYKCGSGTSTYKVSAAESGQAVLTCVTEASLANAGIKIVSGSFGDNCNAGLLGNQTTQVNQACAGKNSCTVGPQGGDPARGCGKTFAVKYRCGDNPTTFASVIAAEATGKTTTVSCAAPIYIRSATFGGNCNASFSGNLTSAVKGSCENTLGVCDYVVSYPYDPARGCGKTFVGTYTCGLDPTVRTVTRAAEATGQTVRFECPVLPPPPTVKTPKGCIPATCSGKTSRNADLACVSDPKLQDLSTFALTSIAISPAGEQSAFGGKIYANSAYYITGSFTHTGTPVNAPLALWATDVFKNKTTGVTTEGFACVLTNVNIQSDGKAGTKTTPLFSNIVSGDCFSQQSSWGDAANRLGMTEAAFRAAYSLAGNKLRASLDPTGKFYVKMARPNPPGFFYKPSIPWVDIIAYYAQTEVTGFTSTAFTFDANPPTVEVGVSTAKLNTAAVALELFSRQDDPSVDVDFTWYASGQHIMNPYAAIENSPTIGALPKGNNLWDRQLRGEVEIYPMGKPTETMSLSGTAGIPVKKALATGTTESAKLQLPRDVIERMFDDWKPYNAFGVRLCMRMNGLAKTAGKQCLPNITVNGLAWNACIGPNLTCQEAGTLAVSSRDAVQRPLEYQRANANVANTKNASSGDSRAKGNQMSGHQNECKVVGTKRTCTAVRANDNQNKGAFGSTYYATNQESHRAQDGGKASAGVDMSGELYGFQVLDMMDSQQEASNNLTASGGWEKPSITLNITPPWDLIIGSASLATKFDPYPIKPVVTKGRYANETGMGIGIGIEGALSFGPIPASIEASATAGISLTLAFTVKFVPENPYPCIGNRGSKCFELNTTRKSMADASGICNRKGGRLAEMITAADQAGITAAAAPAKDWVWLGGQTSFEFTSGKCSRPEYRGDAACLNAATVWYRWIGSDRVFGYISPTDKKGYVYPSAIPTTWIDFTRTIPNTQGIAFKEKTFLEDFYQTDARPFVCEYEAAKTVMYEGFEVRLKLGAGAGVGASICTPHSSLGLCLRVGINFVDASIQPGLTYDHFTLLDEKLQVFGTRGNTLVDIPWELRVLTGSVDAQLNFLFFNINWTVASFSGYRVAGGNLFKYNWPARQDY
jgi:hypothetical protein